MKTDVHSMQPGKSEGSYSRRWLLKSSATLTAMAAAVASLGPGVASAETVARVQSRESPASHGNYGDMEIGGI
jgi:hypothetical protein